MHTYESEKTTLFIIIESKRLPLPQNSRSGAAMSLLFETNLVAVALLLRYLKYSYDVSHKISFIPPLMVKFCYIC